MGYASITLFPFPANIAPQIGEVQAPKLQSPAEEGAQKETHPSSFP